MEAIIIIGAIGWLLLGLAFWLWWRKQMRLPPEPKREGSPIDVTVIARRLERVRANYVAALPQAQSDRALHIRLLSVARRSIANLSFFRRRLDDRDPFWSP